MKKNNTTIFITLGIFAFLAVMFWLGKPSTNTTRSVQPANLSASTLVNSETFFDFGTISMAAGKVSHDFKFKNTTAKPIITEQLLTSCMCTTATFNQGGEVSGPFGMPGHNFVPPLRKTIAPGEEVTILVTFDPAAHGPAGVGQISREIYLNSRSEQILKLAFRANVTP